MFNFKKIKSYKMLNVNSENSDLKKIDDQVFKICGFELSNVQIEAESQEYFATQFLLNGLPIKFRIAKITPTKIGQFVTIWKRNKDGKTVPFDISDQFEFYIIVARQNTNFGFFIFPKTILLEHKILANKKKDGKRGIRVYPSWDVTISKQAQKTQMWQNEYFIDLSPKKDIDFEKLKNLLSFDKERFSPYNRSSNLTNS